MKNRRLLLAVPGFLAGLLCLILEPSFLTLLLAFTGIGATIVFSYVSSEWVESGFAAISYKLRISAILAGALFLATSSSAPEFFTAFSGVVLHGIFDIGILTILWSALFNLCIIIGVCSLYKGPLTVNPRIIKRDMPFYGISILLLAILGLDNGYSTLDFILLIAVYVVYVGFVYFDKSKPYQTGNHDNWSAIIIKIAFGLILVGLLSHTLVTLGLRIVSISESLLDYVIPVGLVSIVIFAPATSISDLFMSVAATKKGQDSTAIVNGIGSNTFDITVCLGVPGLIFTLLEGRSVEIQFSEVLRSLGVLAIGYVLVFIIIWSDNKVVRAEGWLLTIYFVAAVLVEAIILLT